ncbi:transglutaminase-like domain-containing protein [Pseudaestuariivita sp.]|uniref:transglutaminase-like domain-containing protein n=1 Tax=Pseudaestuariivita sp. TaxID=2211669 RepID=UPI004058136B
MTLVIDVTLDYALPTPTDLLLQIEVADVPSQTLSGVVFETSELAHMARVPADEGIGSRVWMRAEHAFQVTYHAEVEIDRPDADLQALPQTPPHLLPGDAVRYLMPSRYCPSDEFQSFVAAEFGELEGGARIAAMRDWIARAFSYVPGSSNAQTTALDTFVQRQGVCRDYAHVLVTLARASTVPARLASVYAPGVTPPDFHAVAEVFLDGAWRLVDATGMARASEMAVIGVGTDASNAAFLTSFGRMDLVTQTVSVTERT